MHELIANYGQTALFWIMAALGSLLARFVWQRIRQDWLRGMLQRLWAEVDAVVRDVWQTYVKELKAGREDGKLTAEEKQHAKDMALKQLKSNFGVKALSKLAKVLGIESLDDWLGTQIESSLNTQKLAAKAVSPPKP